MRAMRGWPGGSLSDFAHGAPQGAPGALSTIQEIKATSSHHDYTLEITAQHDALKPFAPENGRPLRFAIGDAVIFTNEFGAQFRLRITAIYRPTGLSGLYARGARYLLDSAATRRVNRRP